MKSLIVVAFIFAFILASIVTNILATPEIKNMAGEQPTKNIVVTQIKNHSKPTVTPRETAFQPHDYDSN